MSSFSSTCELHLCSCTYSVIVDDYWYCLQCTVCVSYKVNRFRYCLVITGSCFVVILPLQKVQERWYEKLHEWEKALNAYERQQEKNPDDTNFLYGRMRCLEALGEW